MADYRAGRLRRLPKPIERVIDHAERMLDLSSEPSWFSRKCVDGVGVLEGEGGWPRAHPGLASRSVEARAVRSKGGQDEQPT